MLDRGMPFEAVTEVLDAFEAAAIRVWLEGGWGVDALVGRQTRPHDDVDVDLDARQERAALSALAGLGYAIETDQRPTRVALSRPESCRVDVHPLQFDPAGNARQAAPDGGAWHIPRHFFRVGRLHGRPVGCFTVEAQRRFHSGYALRPRDRIDLDLLDRLETEETAAGLPWPDPARPADAS